MIQQCGAEMMQVHVIILAGGVGSRMKADKPKQFIEIDGVPVIVDTIRNFERNNRITGITVVCLRDWIPHLKQLVTQYGLNKVTSIIAGGETGHDSTRNGIFSLRDTLSDNDFVVIHDAARPLIPQLIIDDMLDVAFRNGNACTAIACHDTVIKTEDGVSGTEQIERSSFLRVQTPQAYRYGLILPLYERAEQEDRHQFIYANTMAIEYGTRIFFSKGFDCNIKITTKEDIAFYKAMSKFSEEELTQ